MSNGNINFNIEKLPESPLFWILVVIGLFIFFLATGHVATALVFFLSVVAVACLIINLNANQPSDILWWVCVICAVFALVLGIALVPDDWHTQVAKTALEQTLITQILV